MSSSTRSIRSSIRSSAACILASSLVILFVLSVPAGAKSSPKAKAKAVVAHQWSACLNLVGLDAAKPERVTPIGTKHKLWLVVVHEAAPTANFLYDPAKPKLGSYSADNQTRVTIAQALAKGGHC